MERSPTVLPPFLLFQLFCVHPVVLLPVGNRWLSLCSGLRRLPLTPWETNVVTRLQQPTHSYLARSRSAMSLSGDHAGNVHARGAGGGRGGSEHIPFIFQSADQNSLGC